MLMQDRREERRLRHSERSGDVLRIAGAAGRDHRQRHGVAELLQQVEVVAVLRPVAVDRRHEQLAGAALLAFARPLNGVARGITGRGVRAHASVLGVDRDDDGLAAEHTRELLDQLRPRERRRVDADLVRPGLEHRGRVVERADAASERERDRDLLRNACSNVDGR